jgi:N-acetylneuraminate synthase|tara:strand:- start:1469 stop:2299 length:831 start_codon:yes stop_codon:yes gene_type:complete
MSKTYVIAEIGINHNGDIDLAKQLINKAKNSGCDAVKFQKRTIDVVYSQEELDTPRKSPFGTTTREQKEGIELDLLEFQELEKYSNDLGLDFIVSCWDLNSVDDIENNCNIKYHKVASAMLTDRKFLEKLNDTGRPIIVSVGMATEEEVEKALGILNNVEYILACTSTYPTKADEVNLKYVSTLQKNYPNLKVGFSNHYNGLDACVGSVALGAECVEFHITMDRAMYGSDQPASIENVDDLVNAIRQMELMVGDGVKTVYESEKPIAAKLRKVNDI